MPELECECKINDYGNKCQSCGEYDSAEIVYCPLHANSRRLLEAVKRLLPYITGYESPSNPDWVFARAVIEKLEVQA
mgnify:CR=1 FL=1